MSDTTASTTTAGDFASEAQFLLSHPNLPMPRGLDFLSFGGLSVCLDTAEEVATWAEAVGVEAQSSQYKGNTHHTVYRFEPFYVTASAIVDTDAEVSA